tara:strand:+ start:1667 stop:2011 length:345 start_codon:yes stop_codon:yes gene_type:complete
MGDEVSIEVRSILESLAKILQLNKGKLGELQPTDQLALALTGEMMISMLKVPLRIAGDEFSDEGINQNYLKELLVSAEESFIEHKGSENTQGWVDILAANQDKMVGIFAGGLIG